MPYIRTLNAKPLQTKLASLLERSLVTFSFFFFRSFRATLISLIICHRHVVLWILGLLNYEITVLTALVPFNHCY
jgi:hypothetical protein